jgi:hypothetical protein
MYRSAPFALMLFLLSALSCSDDKAAPADPLPHATGALISVTGCKEFTRSAGDEKNRSCLIWTYDAGSRTLELVHENAGFNCCPKSIDAAIAIEGQIITITESETEPSCRCDCLYDLRMRVDNVQPGRYTIRVVEPYRNKDDEELLAPIDLGNESSGSICVKRFNYPWG